MIPVLIVLVMFLILLPVLNVMFLHTLHCLKRPVLLGPPLRFQIHVVDVVAVVESRCRDGVEMRHVQNRTLGLCRRSSKSTVAGCELFVCLVYVLICRVLLSKHLTRAVRSNSM